MDYKKKRIELIAQYDKFIAKRPKSDRLPIALYYKGMLSEYHPDTQKFEKTETLHFCNSYPYSDTLGIWWELSYKHNTSPEALEAKWRLAMNQAGNGRFETAAELCQIAGMLLENRLTKSQDTPKADTIWTAFSKPATTVMTTVKLNELRIRLRKLELLIGAHNIGTGKDSRARLARFVMLDDHKIDYPEQVEQLFREVEKDDPLMDNILLAKAMLDREIESKAAKLIEITRDYGKTDAGVQARFELGVLNVRLWKDAKDQQLKDQHLKNGRQILTDFVTEYPDSIFANQAQTVLQGLPGGGEAK
jgi:hypothetical protein